jgi:ATP-dependent DNA ligase
MAAQSITIKDFSTEIPGELSEDLMEWRFPVIESTTSNNKTTTYQIVVKLFMLTPSISLSDIPEDAFLILKKSYFKNAPLPSNYYGWIKVNFKYENGEIKKSAPTFVKKGKNLYKKNATNTFTQALRDALSKYNSKLKMVVHEHANVSEPSESLPPMLSQIYKDKKLKNVYMQPKLDGIRAVSSKMDTNAIMYSRKKILFPGLNYIKDELSPIFKSYWESGVQLYLDGEIYKHGMRLQDISGISRKEDNEVKLEYHIYDCIVRNSPKMKFSERIAIVDKIFGENNFTYCKKVETVFAKDNDDIDKIYKDYLSKDYEGAMIRLDEPYRYGHGGYHSNVLLKMKPVMDAEFKIIGYTKAEKGRASESIMFICKTSEGHTFNITPSLTTKERETLLKKMSEIETNGKSHFDNHWLDQSLIVYFDDLSKDGIPMCARTKAELRKWN